MLPKIINLTSKLKFHRNYHVHVVTTCTTTCASTHAKLEQDTTEDQMHHVLFLLNKEHRLKMGESHVLHFLFDFRERHTIESRSEHIANESLKLIFLRTVKSVGSVGVTSAHL